METGKFRGLADLSARCPEPKWRKDTTPCVFKELLGAVPWTLLRDQLRMRSLAI